MHGHWGDCILERLYFKGYNQIQFDCKNNPQLREQSPNQITNFNTIVWMIPKAENNRKNELNHDRQQYQMRNIWVVSYNVNGIYAEIKRQRFKFKIQS